MKPTDPALAPPWFKPWVPEGFNKRLALPLYLYWPYDVLPAWKPGTPDEHGNVCAGRMVVWGDSLYFNDKNALRKANVKNICKTDIVYVPLFAGVDHGPNNKPDPGKGFDDRLPRRVYEHNLALLPEIAKRAYAVLVGNLFCECTWWNYPTLSTDFEHWQAEVRARRFFWPAAEMIREAGGRPAFAPVPRDIYADCFQGRARMRDMFRQLDAVFVTFNGDLILENLCDQLRTQNPEGWQKSEGKPRFKQAADYFEPVECISGVDWDKINEEGWDERAALHGFNGMC